MKLLVLGDLIRDVYVFGRVERMCPEAPVPVLIPEDERESVGGAGLVFGQLKALGCDVDFNYGSKSRKRRFFAGSHLVLRVDNDSYDVAPMVFSDWMKKYDAYVVADYGKGAMTRELAAQIVATKKKVFVDAKHHWDWYQGFNTFVFPNEQEAAICEGMFIQVVKKLGARGCEWDVLKFPATVSEVVDVTGAGDIFMAGFVYAWSLQLQATDSLQFANAIAGESCRHVGTHVVSRAFAQSVLDRLRASRESQPPTPETVPDSNSEVLGPPLPRNHFLWTKEFVSIDSLRADYEPGQEAEPMIRGIPLPEQTRPRSPSVPTGSSDAPTQEDQEIVDRLSGKLQSAQQSQNPISSERQRERKLARDQVWHPKRS
jgi:D-glycero-beta-D-manno-heptose-7-phosphate kinase